MSVKRQQRRLAAILAADVVGYTQAMAANESGTQANVRALLDDVIAPATSGRDGRVFKELGDGCLAEFPSAVGAAKAAVAIQTGLAGSELPLQLRIGLHVGDIRVEGDDLVGDGVIVATRIQSEAEPGGIVVSDAFRHHAEGRAGLAFDDLGTRILENVAEPVRLHLLIPDSAKAAAPTRGGRRRALAAAVVAAIAGSAVLSLDTLTGMNWLGNGARATASPRIAVMPFQNLSPDPSLAFLAEGLARDIITDLAKIQSVSVISPTSSFSAPEAPAGEVAERLNARYMVEGSVHRAAGTLRVTANLIEIGKSAAMWSARYDGAANDVFDFQSQITAQIIGAIGVELTPTERKAVGATKTINPAAYDAYLRGLRLLAERRRLDADANAAAQVAFEEAIQHDPGYALAYAGLAWAKWLHLETINTWDSPDEAFELAEKSLLVGDNALAHRTLAKRHFSLFTYWGIHTRNIDMAVTELEQAQRLLPNDPDVLADLATALPFAGRPREALAAIRKAMELNPNHASWYFASSGIAHLLVGNTMNAIRDLERWEAATPDWNVPYMFLASAYGIAGQVAAAKAAYDRHTHLIGGGPMSINAALRKWPMGPAEREIFVRGLRVAGAKEFPQ